jgi:putative ABC transport system substrate-binding protein
MRRRDFLSRFLGGAAALRPLTVAAQQTERMRRVGVLIPWPENDLLAQASVAAFERALVGFGWVVGKNIRFDYRFAAADPALFKTYAAELVGSSPDAILASSAPAVAALREQTRTLPIVFVLVPDPVELGFAHSLARPGGNITGFTLYDPPLMGKWLRLLREVAPGVTHIAVIFNPDTTPYAGLFNRAIEAAAPSFGMTVVFAPVHDDAGIENAVVAVAHEPGGGVINLPESWSVTHRAAIIAAASRHGLPLMGGTELFPRAGGLMSYWFDAVDVHAQAASYIDRVLKGANPADLPIQDPTRLVLIINLKTAKALGLTVPQSLLQRADEVIE